MKQKQTEKYFKAIVRTPFGNFPIVIKEIDEKSARETIANVVCIEFRIAHGNFRIGEILKTNKRIVSNMYALKKCKSGEDQWGWIGDKQQNAIEHRVTTLPISKTAPKNY